MTSTKEDVKSLSPDLYTILRDILYNAWLIVLAFALGVMGTYVVLRQTYLPQYTSSVTLIVRSRSGTTSNYNNLSASMEMTEVFAEIFLQPTMLEHAARALGEEAFQGKITTEAVENTNILFVRVTGANPTDAFRELSAVLDVYPVIADAISANAVVDVIQPQSVPKAPDNPFTWKDTGIKAGAVCAILTLAAVVLMSYLRDTVKNESDYTKKIGEKLVGSVVHATRNLTLRDKLLTAFGRSRAGKRALMIRSDSGGFLYTENFQKIATKLEYMRRSMDKKIFMFTSVAENEGKSTVTSNLALSLAERGNRVLLMDFDFRKPALYKIFEVDVPRETELGELLSGKLDVREFRFLQYRQSSLFLAINRHAYFDYADWMASPDVRAKLDLFRNMFDYILIDTNPNLSLLNFNIVNASHYVLIPAQPASFDLDGLAVVLQFVEGIKPYNPTLQVGGIIINRYDARNRLITEAAMDQLRESYSELLFEQIIRVDSRLQNAQWENRPVLDYAGSARISKEYRALTKEILKRCV